MTLVAGIACLSGDVQIPLAARRLLERSLSRDGGDPRTVIESDRMHLVHVDIGALRAPGVYQDPARRVSLLCGDPTLHDGSDWVGADRTGDLARLHESTSHDRLAEALAMSTGAFSFVHADLPRGTLLLATDKCGMRPIHVWQGAGLLAFASQLRTLEALPFIPKRPNIRALTQRAAISYMLGDVTSIEDVRVLQPGEVLSAGPEGVRTVKYWRWDDLAKPDGDERELGSVLYDRFQAAVMRRRGGDRVSAAFLTGGMDTRAIVSVLLQQGARIVSLNGSAAGEQDQIYARRFAVAIGAHHIEVPGSITSPEYPAELYDALQASLLSPGDWQPERPSAIWAGVGGSVGLGYVHFSAQLVALIRRDLQAGLSAFARQEGMFVPLRLLHRDARASLRDVVEQDLLAEVNAFNFEDPARALHMAVVLNDTRRASHAFIANIDRHRVDALCPLCDTRLLEVSVTAPMDDCLGHRLYNRMIEPLRDVFERAPWQTYPGHLPCPVPGDASLQYQWSEERLAIRRRERHRTQLGKALWTLGSARFPSRHIRRSILAMATLAHVLRLRDMDSIIEAAFQYVRQD